MKMRPWKMRRLKRLLPKASPAARSGESTRTMAATPVPSSGRDVAVASSRTPTKARLNPVLNEMMSADLARNCEATRMTTATPAN